jgi:hypothetical protein
MRRSAGGVASISAFEFKVVGCNHTQAHKHTYKQTDWGTCASTHFARKPCNGGVRLLVHAHGCLCVRPFACACVHVCARMEMCVCARACVRVCVHACVCACVRACVRACVPSCVCVCARLLACVHARNAHTNGNVLSKDVDRAECLMSEHGYAYTFKNTRARMYAYTRTHARSLCRYL